MIEEKKNKYGYNPKANPKSKKGLREWIIKINEFHKLKAEA